MPPDIRMFLQNCFVNKHFKCLLWKCTWECFTFCLHFDYLLSIVHLQSASKQILFNFDELYLNTWPNYDGLNITAIFSSINIIFLQVNQCSQSVCFMSGVCCTSWCQQLSVGSTFVNVYNNEWCTSLICAVSVEWITKPAMTGSTFETAPCVEWIIRPVYVLWTYIRNSFSVEWITTSNTHFRYWDYIWNMTFNQVVKNKVVECGRSLVLAASSYSLKFFCFKYNQYHSDL